MVLPQLILVLSLGTLFTLRNTFIQEPSLLTTGKTAGNIRLACCICDFIWSTWLALCGIVLFHILVCVLWTVKTVWVIKILSFPTKDNSAGGHILLSFTCGTFTIRTLFAAVLSWLILVLSYRTLFTLRNTFIQEPSLLTYDKTARNIRLSCCICDFIWSTWLALCGIVLFHILVCVLWTIKTVWVIKKLPQATDLDTVWYSLWTHFKSCFPTSAIFAAVFVHLVLVFSHWTRSAHHCSWVIKLTR